MEQNPPMKRKKNKGCYFFQNKFLSPKWLVWDSLNFLPSCDCKPWPLDLHWTKSEAWPVIAEEISANAYRDWSAGWTSQCTLLWWHWGRHPTVFFFSKIESNNSSCLDSYSSNQKTTTNKLSEPKLRYLSGKPSQLGFDWVLLIRL